MSLLRIWFFFLTERVLVLVGTRKIVRCFFTLHVTNVKLLSGSDMKASVGLAGTKHLPACSLWACKLVAFLSLSQFSFLNEKCFSCFVLLVLWILSVCLSSTKALKFDVKWMYLHFMNGQNESVAKSGEEIMLPDTISEYLWRL